MRGLQLSPLDGGRSVRLDPVETAVPTPDGLHFVVYEYENSTRVSTVTLRTTDGLALVSRATFNGYVHRIKPSPARLGDMLVTWADCAGCTTAGQGDLTFVDLPGRRVLERFSEVDAAADWLPDGRYVHVDAVGRVHLGTPGGTRSQTGTLTVAGRKLKGLRVDPAGRQMITRWVRGTSTAATDLWISSIDGTNLQQLTATGLTTYGFWSPDGALFGFDVDTDSGCNTTGCSAVPTGQCDLYFAASGNRNLNLAGNQARPFTVVDQAGRSKTLGCNLRGWTR